MRYLLFILILLCLAAWGPFSFLTNTTIDIAAIKTNIVAPTWLEKTSKMILAQANNMDPAVLKVGLTAYQNARAKGLDEKGLLTIIDYSKPSSERRLWVVNVNTGKVLFNTWVAHGKNSGEKNATSFSNDPESLKSSIGIYLTDDTYSGHHGDSLRIQGLEPGFNDNALKRNIVFHGAAYVGEDIAKNRGMLGRSWGCMAVAFNTIKPLVNAIKNKTLVVAYYPDKNWLRHSLFLS